MDNKFLNITLLLSYGRTANRMIQRTFIEAEANRYKKSFIIHPGIPEWNTPSTFGYSILKNAILLLSKFIPGKIQRVSSRAGKADIFQKPLTVVADNCLQVETLRNARDWANREFLGSKIDCCKCALSGKIRPTEGYLVAHVRLGDIWDNQVFKRKDYLPLPVGYYRALSTLTAKPIAFLMEDQQESIYAKALVDNCPNSVILEGGCIFCDFKTLSTSKLVAIATSTFSWFATWISNETKKIYIPSYGFLDKKIRPDIDLIDKNDDRNVVIEFEYPEFSDDNDYVKWLMSPNELVLKTSK